MWEARVCGGFRKSVIGMGGFGSGRHGGAKKRRVEAQVALKLTELQRAGALAPNASGTLSLGAAVTMAFRSAATDFTLVYQLGDGASAKSIVERVPLERVAAGFGGTRRYFRCPGAECGRRVMVLYLANGRLRCRDCYGLAYESQCEDVWRRALRRADKVRVRLQYPPWNALRRAPVVRPNGMWRQTFARLQYMTDAADHIANTAYVGRLRNLADRMDRRARRHGWS
jgi:hypothetical protein